MSDCNHRAGPDPCYGQLGHDGDHWTYWGRPDDRIRVTMHWRGTEEWARHE